MRTFLAFSCVALVACANPDVPPIPEPDVVPEAQAASGSAPSIGHAGGGKTVDTTTDAGGAANTSPTRPGPPSKGHAGSPPAEAVDACDAASSPSDTHAKPAPLANITDCDPAQQATSALGANDADWFTYHGTDAVCGVVDVIAPYAEVSVPSLSVCLFVKQDGNHPFSGCAKGSESSEMGADFVGCCGVGDAQVADFGHAVVDNSATVFIRVTSVGAIDGCTPYTLTYQFNKH